jgi:hypothetical protein
LANGDDYSDEDYELYGNLLDQGVDPDEYTIIYDDYGDIIIEGTFSDLYEQTLTTGEEFEEFYGEYTITDLIYDLEIAYDIEWDWDTWRELYG